MAYRAEMTEARSTTIGGWIIGGLLALVFVMTGGGKVLAMPPSPENFARWGLSTNLMMLIGALEIAGGIGLLLRPLAPLAAVGLIGLMCGAVRVGLVFHETMHVVLPAVLLVLLSLFIYLRRGTIARWFGR